jgi:hypothetical protein
MLFGTSKSKQVKAVEREIAGLESRKSELRKLHEQAIADAAAAEANLEKFLDKGDLSGGLDGAQTAVHFAKQNALDLAAAVARQERLIIGAAERLQQAHDREQREKAGAAREKAADDIEAAAGELQRAIDVVAAAFDRLCGAIPHNAVDIKGTAGAPTYWGWAGRSPDQPLNAVEIARCVLAESLYEKSPEAFEVISRNSDVLIQLPLLTRRAGKVARGIQRDDVEFGDAIASAKAFIAEPLRALAEDIRAGVAPLDAPARLALPPPPPPEPTIEMLLLKPVYWRDRSGRVHRGDAWHSAHLPVSVSKRAIELGVAVKMHTPKAEQHIQARRDQIGGPEYNPAPAVDLGAV